MNERECNNNEKKKFFCNSSTSSSDISEDMDLQQEDSQKSDEVLKEEPDIKRHRSKSDGAPLASSSPANGESSFEVFPSLPNSVLQKMGLLGDGTRERLTDEEIEEKFVTLSLAFTIDAATIKDRCERQRRYRDQTETNLNKEIERLVAKVNRLQPLCVDMETTELLTALLAQVDIIIRATAHSAISAERFGAVQHEERLAESVQLMINHVNVLKQQRDSARRQLQYTKRVLQDTNSGATSPKPKLATHLNGRVTPLRRASIATISQPHQETTSKRFGGDIRRVIRRTSELSLRGSSLPRANRPSRLELGVDLVKICESTVENLPTVVVEDDENEANEEENSNQTLDTNECTTCNQNNQNIIIASQEVEVDLNTLNVKDKLIYRTKKMSKSIETIITDWFISSNRGEIFYFCALMCLSLGIITMGNVLVEFECAKRGSCVPLYFWNLGFLWTENDTGT